MATQVTEREARQVAEEAREGEWKLPSFGKELFLGNFRLDLIHPQPRLDAEAVEKGERFLERLRAFLVERVDPLEIERDARIPDAVIDGLKELGALGMKVPEEYGGLGLSQVYYNRALALAGSWHASLSTLLSAHQSIGVAEPLRLFGTEEQKQKWLPLVARDHISAFLLTEPDVGSRPGAAGHDRRARRRRLPAQRHEAVGDQRRDRRRRRRDGQGAGEGHHRLRPAVRHRGRHRRAPQRVHGPARDRELGHPARGRLRARREPDRRARARA